MNASPVVWQRKKDKSIQICADLKIYINDKIMTDNYPLPDMETFFHELEGSNFMSRMDFSTTCYQIILDDAVQDICVVNTTLGLVKLLRLPQGMQNASGIIQR